MDCPVFNAQLKYDIEHIEEIDDLFWRLRLKNALGLPRTEKDLKEIAEWKESMKRFELQTTFTIDPKDSLVDKAKNWYETTQPAKRLYGEDNERE